MFKRQVLDLKGWQVDLKVNDWPEDEDYYELLPTPFDIADMLSGLFESRCEIVVYERWEARGRVGTCGNL